MAGRMLGQQTPSRLVTFAATFAAMLALLVPSAEAVAQDERKTLVQFEVRDSVGLPLPDAAVEVFTVLEGGVFWEWVRVGADDLPEGINLLRFSHAGYEPTTFSVPLREGSVLSLRVRLMPERDSAARAASLDARPLSVIGLAIEGRMKSDAIGHRRIVERNLIEQDATHRFGPLMRRVRNTELTVTPGSGGSFRVGSHGSTGGRSACPMLVMVNGDRKKVFPFVTFDQLYGTQELEVLEVFPRGASIPNAYQISGYRCGMMVAWFKLL